MYRFNVSNSMQGNNRQIGGTSAGGCGSCQPSSCQCRQNRRQPSSCQCQQSQSQPMTCRPCCCPAYVVCCCGGTTTTPSPTTFSVTYDPNGGTGGATDSNLALGTRYTIKSNGEVNVIRPGYTFTGWNTEPDGSGISYAAGSTIDIKGDVTLYAQWDPITFDVSYEANGGTGEYNDPDIPANSQYIIKTQDQTGITNAGKTITIWNTEAAGTGTSYAPGSSTTLDKDLTLYAQWST